MLKSSLPMIKIRVTSTNENVTPFYKKKQIFSHIENEPKVVIVIARRAVCFELLNDERLTVWWHKIRKCNTSHDNNRVYPFRNTFSWNILLIIYLCLLFCYIIYIFFINIKRDANGYVTNIIVLLENVLKCYNKLLQYTTIFIKQ